jgi:hypothetical protein
MSKYGRERHLSGSGSQTRLQISTEPAKTILSFQSSGVVIGKEPDESEESEPAEEWEQ